jgi:hypothetical protein
MTIQPLWLALQAFSEDSIQALIDADAIKLQKVSPSSFFTVFSCISNKASVPLTDESVARVLSNFISLGLHTKAGGVESVTNALQCMCKLGFMSCIKILFGAMASVIHCNVHDIVFRIMRGSDVDCPEIVEFLMQQVISVENVGNNWYLALENAVTKRRLKPVRLMLAAKPSLFSLQELFKCMVATLRDPGANEKGMRDVASEIFKELLNALMALDSSKVTPEFLDTFFQLACLVGQSHVVCHLLTFFPPSSTHITDALAYTVACNDEVAYFEVLTTILSRLESPLPRDILTGALHFACTKAHSDTIRVLLEAGGTDTANKTCLSALIFGGESDPIDCLKLLLGNLTDPLAAIDDSLFTEVCRKSFLESLKAILAVSPPKYEKWVARRPLVLSCDSLSAKACELVRVLIEHGYVGGPSDIEDALMNACILKNVECVRILLELPAPQCKRQAHLLQACNGSDDSLTKGAEIVKLLLSHRLDRQTVRSQIRTALTEGNFRVADILCAEYKFTVEAKILTELFTSYLLKVAHRFEFLDMVDTLSIFKTLGADLNSAFVHFCTSNARINYPRLEELCRALLVSGANPCLKKDGEPLLYYLAKFNFEPLLLRLMIQAGAVVDVKAFEGATQFFFSRWRVRSALPWTPESKLEQEYEG